MLSTECPADFTPLAGVNGCYKVVNQNLEWLVAGLHCQSLHTDAHLLVINDAAEQSAVGGMLDILYIRNRQFVVHVLLYCMNLEF